LEKFLDAFIIEPLIRAALNLNEVWKFHGIHNICENLALTCFDRRATVKHRLRIRGKACLPTGRVKGLLDTGPELGKKNITLFSFSKP
jgi:hypothetical protein